MSDTVQNKPAKPRGRPRQFDEDAVLDRAMAVFRVHGYDGATVDLLAREMGLAKPSFYRAFGNRRNLYERVIFRYSAQVHSEWLDAVRNRPSFAAAMERFYSAVLAVLLPTGGQMAGDGESGCLIITTMPAAAGADETIRQTLLDLLTTADTELALVLEQEYPGRFESSAETPLDVARWINGSIHSLAIRARADEPRANINQIVAFNVATISKRPM